MKHILTTNEPFLLERNSDVYKDLTQATTVLRFEDLPWLSYTWNGNDYSAELYYIFLQGCFNNSTSPSDNEILITRLDQIYSAGDGTNSGTPWITDLTSGIGKLLQLKFPASTTPGMYEHMFGDGVLIIDKEYDKVYLIDVGGTNGIEGYRIRFVKDWKFNLEQIYSLDREFGTHLWFNFGLIPWKKIPDTTLDDNNSEAWIYIPEFRPIYWDQVRLTSQLVSPLLDRLANNQSIEYWEESENYFDFLKAYIAHWHFDGDYSYSGNKTLIYPSPNVYWDFTNMAATTYVRITTSAGDLGLFNGSSRLLPIQGKFIAGIDNLPISNYDDYIIFPDNLPSIVSGHTYEFNIFDGVFNLIDVTQTTT
jgi:hypothetical protein